MRYALAVLVVGIGLLTTPCGAQDYRAEPLNEPPPADEMSPEIAKLIAPTGVRIIRGTSRTYCDIWLCKQWKVAKLEPASGLLYPFASGQLIGVVRYGRRGADFRDQDVEKGVYTIRYEKQPVDGAHVGTSITRDFVLLVSTEVDKQPGPLDYDALTEASSEVAGTAHPALLSLQKAKADQKPGSLRNDEEKDWWLLNMMGKASGPDEQRALPLELVVVGVAAE